MAEQVKQEAKALIVGASGQVGRQFLHALGERALPTSRQAQPGWLQMDLAGLSDAGDAAAVLDAHDIDVIYCVGGMTHVDGCESEPDLAWRTNGVGPGVLAAYAQRRGLPFVFFSTEYVFDGDPARPGPYTESSATNPLSVYGKSKLHGEHAVLDAHGRALVLRTTVVYGPDANRKNYVYALIRNLSTGTAMRVPEDQISTPTYNRDLIAAALGLVEAGASGVFHVSGPELLGRLEFARQVAQHLGLDGSLLQGVTTAALRQAASRPLAAGLDTSKLRSIYPKLRMRTLAESIRDCRAELMGAL